MWWQDESCPFLATKLPCLYISFHPLVRLPFKSGRVGAAVVKNPPANVGDQGLIPGLGRSPGEGNVTPLQYSCLGNPMDGRSLAGYSPWGHRESDMTELAHKGMVVLQKCMDGFSTHWDLNFVPVMAQGRWRCQHGDSKWERLYLSIFSQPIPPSPSLVGVAETGLGSELGRLLLIINFIIALYQQQCWLPSQL